MNTELRIRDILGGAESIEKKIEDIQKFMNWDKKKLRDAIERHGTASDNQRKDVVVELWRDVSKDKKKR